MAKASISKKTEAAKTLEGKSIKDFSIASSEGTDFKLSDYKGKKIVLYFYPKDSTPGCTTEGIDFNKKLATFKKNNTEIFGISRDSVKSHCNFIEKQGFKFELLSDADEKLCKMFDVIKEKNMYGKKVMGIERSTFLLNEKGILIKEWRKVKVDGHVDEVLEFIKKMD
jgi:peroxiredoxin Q/BCP